MDAAMVFEECTSPNNDTLDKYRFEVVGATFDELDNHHDQTSEEFSAASTVDVDNTHPYLLRYADAYAQEINDATSPNADRTGPTFVGVKPSAMFEEGQHVMYTGNNSTSCEAIIMKNLYDDNQQPHYTIKLASGAEEQTGSDKLDRKIHNGAKDENGEAPKNCVDFKTNPTTLFRALYQSEWENAAQSLANNPEEASIWVTRYVNMGNEPNNNREIRWQLLPLHLYICLVGRRNEDALAGGDIDGENKASDTLKLLTDLLLAYPQATQCTDDRNMIPLHSAIRGTSSLAVINKLLEVDPTSVYRKDARNRNAFQLVEKIYEKHIHKQQVGSEDEATLVRYAGLMELLSDAARRVSTITPTPAPTPTADGVQRVQKRPPDDELNGYHHDIQKQLLQLQNDNLSLRRENAELHHRAEINARLLLQLVEKLKMYEEERSANIENYNEIFGSKDELDEKRKEILVSLSEDDGDIEGKGGVNELQVGDGAYHKRLERYHHKIASTTALGTTGMTTPLSSPSRFNTCAEDVTSDSIDVAGGGEEEHEHDPLNNNKEPCESEESSIQKGQNIFRHNAAVDSTTNIDEPPLLRISLSSEEEDQLRVE